MKLQNKSKYLRKLVIDMIKVRKGGHLGPALSLIEILHNTGFGFGRFFEQRRLSSYEF